MSWSESVVAGAISGLAGIVTAAAVGYAATRWYPFDGAGGYFIALNALLGAAFAFLLGLLAARAWLAWAPSKWKRRVPISRVGGGAAALVVVIGLATTLLLWMLADIPPEIDGQRLNLEVEFRLSPGDTLPPADAADPKFTLASMSDRTKRNELEGVLRIEQARKDDLERWIIPASVLLYTGRGQRLIEASLGGDVIGSFIVPLPGSPGPANEGWSDWLPKVQPVAKGKAPEKGKAPPPPPPKGAPGKAAPIAVNEGTTYRYRVARAGAAPAGTTQARKQEGAPPKFAIPGPKTDFSVAELLEKTRLSSSDAERDTAIKALTARPAYVEELNALMLSQDNRQAADALYAIARLSQPPEPLSAGVIAAGKDIAARIDRINEIQGDANAQFAPTADVTIRFAAWMDAVRVLRRSGTSVNFMPQLVAILERTRVKTDNAMLQHDVRRVASRFAKEWGGIAPAAGDPAW